MYLAPPRSPERLPRAALADRIRHVAPELDPESDRWKVAMVVLAMPGVPGNVDRLAGAAGVPRELAAKVARRLFDNGIAAADVPDPVDAPWERETFWNTVGVAEGTLRRRADGGSVAWIPAGFGLHPAGSDWAPPAEHEACGRAALPELFPDAHWLT